MLITMLNTKPMTTMNKTNKLSLMLWAIIMLSVYSSCTLSSANNEMPPPAPAEYPVINVSSREVTTYSEFTASIEGSRDIEIRSQVDGYISAIHVDEGDYVNKGQSLFKIDARPFTEQLNTANAMLLSAKAALENATINVNKLSPLVQNNIVSDVQLKSAKASYDAALAMVAQAQSQVQTAKINLGFTTIKAPASGYVGGIPYKSGSLVGRTQAEALTVLSENKSVYAYFTMSEIDFINFKTEYSGNTIQDKIKSLPEVELVLADNTIYPLKGRVELAQGSFDKTSGTISFRAIFSNEAGLLRSGNTGKIRIPNLNTTTLLVPQQATFELQDKIFAYSLGDSNKVIGKPITVTGTSGRFYMVSNGLKDGDQIVYEGIGRLADGMIIKPKLISADSLLKADSF